MSMPTKPIGIIFLGLLISGKIPAAEVTTPPTKADVAALDAGFYPGFYAEPNIYVAWSENPADFNLLPRRLAVADVGGDLSFGGVSFKKNEGTSAPGYHEPNNNGLKLNYVSALGGKGLGVYGQDFWVAGGTLKFNRTSASLNYNGDAFTVNPLVTLDDGWTAAEGVAMAYGFTAAGAVDILKPHILGLSLTFAPERLEAQYDHEFTPAEGVTGHTVEGLWGRRELREIGIKGGYSFRPDAGWDVGGAVGVRFLSSGIDWRAQREEETSENVNRNGSEGHLDLKGRSVTITANGRYQLMDNIRLGGAGMMSFTPGSTIDRTGETWDLEGPFGENTAEAFRVAKVGEQRYRCGAGVAFLPDDRTTLGFDYTFDLYRASATGVHEKVPPTSTMALSAYHTYTQLGVERWMSDNLAMKAGWRQDLFGWPRNVFFGGATYKLDDAWLLHYDYVGSQITVNNLSLFVPLDDIIKPASHRVMVAWLF